MASLPQPLKWLTRAHLPQGVCGGRGETPVSGWAHAWELGHQKIEPLLDNWGLELSPPQLPPFGS